MQVTNGTGHSGGFRGRRGGGGGRQDTPPPPPPQKKKPTKTSKQTKTYMYLRSVGSHAEGCREDKNISTNKKTDRDF